MVNLLGLFNHLGDKSEGQLSWDNKGSAWTQWMFQCFDGYVNDTHNAAGQSNYMNIDRVWRDPNLSYLLLAFEHENNFVRKDFLGQEIQHVIDLKATCKLAITYLQLGEEEDTVKEISLLLSRRTLVRIGDPFTEEYLIVFEFATRKDRETAILWKGYRMDNLGKDLDTYTKVVLQAAD